MNIRKIIREEVDDLDWIRDTNPVGVEDVINKAIYFDPTREDLVEEYSEYYSKIIDQLIKLGFESQYGTPREQHYEDWDIVGLYTYRDVESGELEFVYTTGWVEFETIDRYLWHVKNEFAVQESEDHGDNVEVITVFDFVQLYL